LIEVLHAYLWVIGIVVLVVLRLTNGSVVAVLVGHFVLKMFGREKDREDQRGDFSAAVGYLVFVLVWIVISIHPWTWRWGADF
jgi:chromate transport protein ChrA